MSKLKERIEALLRKAQDPSVTEAEAEAFEMKAVQLMVREGITEQDLNLSDEEQVASIIKWEREFFVGRQQMGIEVLFKGIADAFGVATMRESLFRPFQKHGDHQDGVVIRCWSTESQKDMVEAWLDHLVIQLASAVARDRPRSRKSYAVGWANIVLKRFRDFIQVADTKDETFQSGSALALLNSEDVMRAEYPNLRESKVSTTDLKDKLSGEARGTEASMLGKGVTSGSTKALGSGS